MIVDSSVWVDYFAGHGFWQVDRLAAAIADRRAMVVDIVRLEVVAGLAPSESGDRVHAMLDACEDAMQIHRVEVDEGAAIYRACRAYGEIVRAVNDCVVAAIAIRNDVPILHRDRDYDVIAKYTPLRVETE